MWAILTLFGIETNCFLLDAIDEAIYVKRKMSYNLFTFIELIMYACYDWQNNHLTFVV